MSGDDVKRAIEGVLAVHSFARVEDDTPRDERDAIFIASCARPYNGQAHTYHGARGATPLELAGGIVRPNHRTNAITLRDIGDAIATTSARFRVLARTMGGSIDEDAMIGEVLCLLEKMLGTYPNTGKRRGHGANH